MYQFIPLSLNGTQLEAVAVAAGVTTNISGENPAMRSGLLIAVRLIPLPPFGIAAAVVVASHSPLAVVEVQVMGGV